MTRSCAARTPISVKALRVETGTGIIPAAELTLTVEGEDRERDDHAATARWTRSSRPSGKLYPHTATLQLFQINAVTEGTDAQATVSVRLEENGRTVTGQGVGHRHDGGRGLCLCERA